MIRTSSPLSLVLFLLALTWFGCKSDTTEEQSVPGTRTGNSIEVRFQSEPGSLNQITSAGDAYGTQVLRLVTARLLTLHYETGVLAPQLANSRPEVQLIEEGPFAGGVSYTFELYEEATWDNGDPITADDYIFSLKAILNPKVPAQRIRGYFEMVQDVEVDPDNPKKFTVITDKPYILAEEAIAAAIPVAPRYIYDPEGLLSDFSLRDFSDPERLKNIEDDPRLQEFADFIAQEKFNREKGFVVGAGPYDFEEWQSGQQIVLKRKDNWWGSQVEDPDFYFPAHPEEVIFKIIRDAATAATLVRDEELDVAPMIDARDFVDMRMDGRMQELYNFYTPPMMAFYLVYINTRDEMLQDKRVRRALAHLMDVEEIINTVFNGLGEPIVGPIHPAKDYYYQDLPQIKKDVAKAQTLLSEAGWTDTNNDGTVDKMIDGERQEMKLTYLIPPSEANRNIALLFQDIAGQAGIEIEIVSKEFQGVRADLSKRDYQLAGGALSAQPILDDLYQIWHTDSDRPDGFNRVGFGNAQSDELIEEIRKTLDKEKRDQMYRTFQQIVYDEQPMIFLMAPEARIIVHKRFESFSSPVSPNYFPEAYKLKKGAEVQ